MDVEVNIPSPRSKIHMFNACQSRREKIYEERREVEVIDNS
jgi:hypothetical protein